MEVQAAAWAACKRPGIDPAHPPDVEPQPDLGVVRGVVRGSATKLAQAGSAGFHGHDRRSIAPGPDAYRHRAGGPFSRTMRLALPRWISLWFRR